MPSHIEGSSPRKHIKRTHNKNPTFHSFFVHDALHVDPVPQSHNSQLIGINQALFSKSKQEVISKYLTSKAKSVPKLELDSLKFAEQEFAKNKLRNPVNFRQQVVKQCGQVLNFPKPRCLSSSSFQQEDDPFKFNYKHHAQIRTKQLRGYDIISNI